MSLTKIFESLHIGDLSFSSAKEVKDCCLLILEVEKLDQAAISTLDACFEEGPLFDGDIPSKAGRDQLVEAGLVSRCIVKGKEGYNTCTQKGYWARKILSCKGFLE